MLGRRTGTVWGGGESPGELRPQQASPPSPPTGTCGPLELKDRNWNQRGSRGGREGGTERVLAPPLPPPPKKSILHSSDTASSESRWPRLAARRDPRLVDFEKSRDFATLYVHILLKLLFLFCIVLF